MGRWTRGAQNRLNEIEPSLKALPEALSMGVVLANGDANKGREVASIAATAVATLAIRDWVVGMSTAPGDLVRDPAKKYVYMYSGKEAMTHANPLFFPGASGVYYWAIVPEVLEGVKVYPNITGIIVAVKHNEIWWDTAKAKKYIWNAVDNNACNWYPGQDGVHQWVKI